MKSSEVDRPLCYCVVSSPIGWLGLVAGRSGLVAVISHRDQHQLDRELAMRYPSAKREMSDDVLQAAAQQFEEYFGGQRRVFSLPVDLHGCSAFSRKILNTLCEVPFGTAVTYGELASLAGNPGAARAVGRAMAVNPLPVLIPCHRVVGAGGKMTGYSGGDGIATKEWLLRFEGYRLLHREEKKRETVKSP